MSIGGQELIVIGLMILMIVLAGAICAFPFWFICKKAGLSPWLSLIMLIPVGAMVLPYVLAFIEWPSLRNKSGNGVASDPKPSGPDEW